MQGQRTNGGRSLHYIDPAGIDLNPYQKVIKVMGATLEQFDDDHMIPTFGFGEITTKGQRVFPFLPDRSCVGFSEVSH